jgi:hypothetical protein
MRRVFDFVRVHPNLIERPVRYFGDVFNDCINGPEGRMVRLHTVMKSIEVDPKDLEDGDDVREALEFIARNKGNHRVIQRRNFFAKLEGYEEVHELHAGPKEP